MSKVQKKFLANFEKSLHELEDWFERQKRVLPWREEPTLYRVWISEIMLQQTQVITVIPYFERFIGRFPTVGKLAQASEEDVMTHWAGLGYYSRARNLHRGAKMIVEAGGFPKTRDTWLEIPGVGPYTAGAVVSIALDHPEPILDGNVERVLSRVHRVGAGGAKENVKEKLWKLSQVFVSTAHENKIKPSVLNQALMELGATVCTPKNPKCSACPLTGICRARATDEIELYPAKKKKKEWIAVKEQVHCFVNDEGKVLLEKRKEGQWRSGLWDLPEEVPFSSRQTGKKVGLIQTQHIVTRHKITRETSVYRLEKKRGLQAAESLGILSGEKVWRWESLEKLLGSNGTRPAIAVGSALKRTLSRVLARFPEAVPER